MYKHAPSGVLTGKNATDSDLVTGDTIQSAMNIQSTFLDMSRSPTTWHLPHSMLELCHAKTTTSASQLKAHLQAAWANHFLENHITKQSACRRADRDSQQGPQRLWPKCWQSDLIPMFTAWFPHAKRWPLWMLNTPLCIKHVLSVHRILCKISSAVCLTTSKSASIDDDLLETNVCSANMQLITMKYSRTLAWDSHNSHAISHALHDSRSTAAIVSLLAGICTTYMWPTVTRVVGVTFPVSWRHSSNHQNTIASRQHWPRQQSVYSCAAVPAWLLQVLRIKSMSQFLLCVYSTNIESQLITDVLCVLTTSNNVLCNCYDK
jgi:hypothetical protein